MRTLLGAALFVALVVTLSAVPSGLAGPGGPASTPPVHAGVPALRPVEPAPERVQPGPSVMRPVDATLRTANVTSPQTGAPPTSAIFANPPPTLPPTTPDVVTVASNTTNCCSYLDFPAPAGPFALIELNYTGTAYGSVYDSSYRAYVDGVPILFGTTPEFGRWIVLKDLTEDAALFQGEVNVTFLLSAAIISGSFTSTVTVSFYPVPSGAPAPRFATEVLPLWTAAYVKSGVPTLTANVTVPSNATNVTLELYAYGFSADEFWYASEPTEAAFRAVQVSADGSPIATVLPFPYLNTGGLDLFLWRPIPADFTLNDRPYRVDLTAALGQLEGTHAISVTVIGRDAASPWLVMGGLFVTTADHAPAAVTTADTVPPIVDHTSNPTGSSYDNLGTVGYSFASTFSGPGGTTNVSSSVVEQFVNNATVASSSGWENLTGVSTMTFYTNVTTPTTSRSSWVTYDFVFGVDIGGSFVETSNTGGGYPIYGNFTSYTLNVVQEWNESGFTVGSGAYTVDERLGASGVYAGREERISANAAQILSINFIQSQTTEEYVYRLVNGSLTESADHLLVGSSYQPPGPNNVETVTVDRWDTPLAATLVPSVTVADLGEPFTFTGTTLGGRGGIFVAWVPGVPKGCSSTASPFVLNCRPTATGTLTATMETTDGAGDAPATVQASVIVLADPVATIASSPPEADLGMSFNVTPTIIGGVAPYRCTWTIVGGSSGRPGSCAIPLSVPADTSGPLGVTLTIGDATGGSWSYGFNLTVNPLPFVTVETSVPSTTVGSGIEVSANLTGGTGPFTVNWTVAIGNGAATPAGTGMVIVFTPPAAGVYVFTATIVDGLGRSAVSAPANLTVVAAGSLSSGASGSSLPTWQFLGLVAALVVEAIAVVALLVMRQQGRRPRPPSPPVRRSAPAVARPPDGEE